MASADDNEFVDWQINFGKGRPGALLLWHMANSVGSGRGGSDKGGCGKGGYGNGGSDKGGCGSDKGGCGKGGSGYDKGGYGKGGSDKGGCDKGSDNGGCDKGGCGKGDKAGCGKNLGEGRVYNYGYHPSISVHAPAINPLTGHGEGKGCYAILYDGHDSYDLRSVRAVIDGGIYDGYYVSWEADPGRVWRLH